jgi:hypothetical protein
MPLQGKGFFCEDLRACEGGDPAAILAAARAAGLTHIIVKIADGTQPAGLDLSGSDSLLPTVRALKQGGIVVWGSQPIYGDDPAAEAQSAIERLLDLGLEGFVVRPGPAYQARGRERAARVYMHALRRAMRLQLALSAYRFPQYHPRFPWTAFLENCDLHMPQVFWEAAHDAGAQLRESQRQCAALPAARPFVPVAAAYGPSGTWSPRRADLADFLDAACSLDLPIVDFFYWESCRSNLPELWETITAFHCPTGTSTMPQPAEIQPAAPATSEPPAVPAPVSTPAVQPASPAEADDFSKQFLAALNSRQPARVAALYASGATCVRADRILHGTAEIQADYATFFADLPLEASFALISTGSQGMVRTLTWKAGVLNVLTTIVIEAGKITQDYTHLG